MSEQKGRERKEGKIKYNKPWVTWLKFRDMDAFISQYYGHHVTDFMTVSLAFNNTSHVHG